MGLVHALYFHYHWLAHSFLTNVIYFTWAKPKRERYRLFYFSNMASDEPDSYFQRAWAQQLPDFPTTKEEWDDLSFRRDFEIFRDPPLVPYDVKGYDKSRLKNIDLAKEKLNERCINPMWNFLTPN